MKTVGKLQTVTEEETRSEVFLLSDFSSDDKKPCKIFWLYSPNVFFFLTFSLKGKMLLEIPYLAFLIKTREPCLGLVLSLLPRRVHMGWLGGKKRLQRSLFLCFDGSLPS